MNYRRARRKCKQATWYRACYFPIYHLLKHYIQCQALNAAVKAKEHAEKKLKEMKKDGKRSTNQQNYYRVKLYE